LFPIKAIMRSIPSEVFSMIPRCGMILILCCVFCSCGNEPFEPGAKSQRRLARIIEETAAPKPEEKRPRQDPPTFQKGEGSPLITAVREGDAESFQVLMQKGVSVLVTDTAGRSALHWAALKGRGKMADLLIQSGAVTGSKDADGRTPLHLAARAGAGEVVRSLLKAGAAPDVRDGEGYLPVEFAFANGEECAAHTLLEDAMERLQADPGRSAVRAVAIRYMEALKAGDASLLRELSVPGTPEPPADLVAPLELGYAIQQTDLFEDGAVVAGTVEQPDWLPMRFVMALKPHEGTWRVLGTSLWVER